MGNENTHIPKNTLFEDQKVVKNSRGIFIDDKSIIPYKTKRIFTLTQKMVLLRKKTLETFKLQCRTKGSSHKGLKYQQSFLYNIKGKLIKDRRVFL